MHFFCEGLAHALVFGFQLIERRAFLFSVIRVIRRKNGLPTLVL